MTTKTRPRIVHLIHSSAFGGGPNMLAILCLRLSDEFDMEVICDGLGDVPGRLEASGIRIRRLPLTTKWSFLAQIPRLAATIRRLKPDLVHLHGQFAGSLGQIALRLGSRPTSLYHVQWPSYLDDIGPWSRLRNQTAESVSCRFPSAVVAVSQTDRAEFIKRGLCPPEKITVIHNAYSIEIEDAASTAPPSNGEVIGFVGRLSDQKGCEYLIQAAPGVLRKHPQAKFLVIGDGPERAKLEILAQTLGVAGAVEFAGYQPEPARLIPKTSLVVIPSIYDPFPLVTLEVMALGRPVVGSAVGGIPEAVVDGTTGVLVPPRDPEAIGAAIDRLLDNPPLLNQMGEAGRKRAQERYSPTVIAPQFAQLYRRLLATKSS